MGNKPEEDNKIYRLTLLEDRTHKKIRSVRFSRFNMIATIVTAFVLLTCLAFCIIAFTPIRTIIPGYPDVRSRNQAVENAIRIDSLENAIVRWELFYGNLSRVLAGETTVSLDSLVQGTRTKYLKDVDADRIAGQEELLRQKTESK